MQIVCLYHETAKLATEIDNNQEKQYNHQRVKKNNIIITKEGLGLGKWPIYIRQQRRIVLKVWSNANIVKWRNYFDKY